MGNLHFGLTAEASFAPHESLPWNPLIARVFYRRGIIEQWGRGTIRMAELATSTGLPAPEIEAAGGGVTVRFRPKEYVPPRRVERTVTEREAIRNDPPDILLTNYMMLELMLTRSEDRALVRAAQGFGFLVFDELHTYRGRQGADVAMLIRRCRRAFGTALPLAPASVSPPAAAPSASAPRPRWPAAGAARSSGVKWRRCRSPCSGWISRPNRSSARRWSGRRRRSAPRIHRFGTPYNHGWMVLDYETFLRLSGRGGEKD